jgi:hypothetical protein
MDLVAMANALSGRRMLTVGAAFAFFVQGCATPMDDEETDDEVEDVGETTQAQNAGCPKTARGASYALCVWQSRQGAEKLTIFNRNGKAVRSGEVTTSNSVAEGGSITCTGQHRVINYQAQTSLGLKNFFSIEGCGEEGFHYYPDVGAAFDSHGCVRVKWAMSEWMRLHLVDKIGRENIYVYIIGPK